MKRGLEFQILWIPIALFAFAIFGVTYFIVRSSGEYLVDQLKEDLGVRAEVVVEAIKAQPHESASEWDRIADREGETLGVRVTLVDASGNVLGDSQLSLDEVHTAENHLQRAEIQDARKSGKGESVRQSVTLKRSYLYVARPFSVGETNGYVRLARTLPEIDATLSRFRRRVFLAALATLALVAFVLFRVARRITKDVGTLTNAAHEMTEGRLDVRTNFKGFDELGTLGVALDRLSSSLSASLADLRREHGRLDRILHGMQEGVVLLDEHGRIVLVNAALRSILLVPGVVEGKAFADVIRDAELVGLFRRGLEAKGNLSEEVELGGLKPRRLLVQLVALDQELLAVFVDVTELRRLEKIRKDFVANVSHELRTPVSAVRSATETLQGGAVADPTAAKRFLDIVDRNAKRLEDLIENLLELSRVESKEFQPRLEDVELGSALAQVVALYRERAEKKKIRIVLDIPSPLVVVVDPRAVEQIVGNLVDNAVKYCGEDATITVSARASSTEFECEVTDTGPGIDEKHLSRLFERFYRVDKGRSRDIGGTGLGLSIVKHLAEVLGGAVSVSSKVGFGTTFTVTFPKDGRQSLRVPA